MKPNLKTLLNHSVGGLCPCDGIWHSYLKDFDASLRIQRDRKDLHRREADAYRLRSDREREIARLFMIAGEHEQIIKILGEEDV